MLLAVAGEAAQVRQSSQRTPVTRRDATAPRAATPGGLGNLMALTIPGGFTIRFTAFRATRPDGSPYHGVGIRPTVPASRTVKGVIEGRDEVLEAGIAAVSKASERIPPPGHRDDLPDPC